MNSYRCNPDGEENQDASKDNERAVFAAKRNQKHNAPRNRRYVRKVNATDLRLFPHGTTLAKGEA